MPLFLFLFFIGNYYYPFHFKILGVPNPIDPPSFLSKIVSNLLTPVKYVMTPITPLRNLFYGDESINTSNNDVSDLDTNDESRDEFKSFESDVYMEEEDKRDEEKKVPVVLSGVPRFPQSKVSKVDEKVDGLIVNGMCIFYSIEHPVLIPSTSPRTRSY